MMTVSRKLLCVSYALIALVTLVGCWTNNLELMGGRSVLGANVFFWQETLANPVSRSITVDILGLALAAIIWMFLEARRLSMRGIWFWVFFGLFVAIGAAFPLFLIHREVVLARQGAGPSAGTLRASDLAGISLLGIGVLAYAFVAIS